jgi:hypothetical protein
MSGPPAVIRITFFDGPALGDARARFQRSIKRAARGRQLRVEDRADGKGRPDSTGAQAVTAAWQESRSV